MGHVLDRIADLPSIPFALFVLATSLLPLWAVAVAFWAVLTAVKGA